MSARDAIKTAKDNGARIVDLRFIDVPGLWQHFSIPISELSEDLFEEGIGFDGSSIRGYQSIHESDMLLIPDPDTAVMDPFTAEPTMVLTCNVKDPITAKMYSRDPRNIAQKAEAYLKKSGLADVVYIGPELEFFFRRRAFRSELQLRFLLSRLRGGILERRKRGNAGAPEPRIQAALQTGLLSCPADG